MARYLKNELKYRDYIHISKEIDRRAKIYHIIYIGNNLDGFLWYDLLLHVSRITYIFGIKHENLPHHEELYLLYNAIQNSF